MQVQPARSTLPLLLVLLLGPAVSDRPVPPGGGGVAVRVTVRVAVARGDGSVANLLFRFCKNTHDHYCVLLLIHNFDWQ